MSPECRLLKLGQSRSNFFKQPALYYKNTQTYFWRNVKILFQSYNSNLKKTKVQQNSLLAYLLFRYLICGLTIQACSKVKTTHYLPRKIIIENPNAVICPNIASETFFMDIIQSKAIWNTFLNFSVFFINHFKICPHLNSLSVMDMSVVNIILCTWM